MCNVFFVDNEIIEMILCGKEILGVLMLNKGVVFIKEECKMLGLEGLFFLMILILDE